jgi:hypothetical protein
MTTPQPDHYGAGKETRERALDSLFLMTDAIMTLITLTSKLAVIVETKNESISSLAETTLILKHCTKLVVELENMVGNLIDPELEQSLNVLLDRYTSHEKENLSRK